MAFCCRLIYLSSFFVLMFCFLSGFVFPVSHFKSSENLPLDNVSASLAVSTRKLSSSYSGNCIRVRRSSDNTEQDIGFSGNALDTSSLLSFVGANDGFVVRWYDQSGNGRYFNQSTTANQPQIVSSGSVVTGVGGEPALNCDGSNDGFSLLNSNATSTTISNIITASAYTAFSIFTLDTISTSTGATYVTPYLWGDSGRYIGLHFMNTNKLRFYNWDGSEDYAELTVSTGTEYLAETRHESSTLYAKVNNGSEASAASGNTSNVLGSPQLATNSTLFFDGKVTEVIFYNSALSSGDRSTVSTALNNYYTIF